MLDDLSRAKGRGAAMAAPKSRGSGRLSPVDHTYGIPVCGEIVRWQGEKPGDGINTFAVRGATEETVVGLPARALDVLGWHRTA